MKRIIIIFYTVLLAGNIFAQHDGTVIKQMLEKEGFVALPVEAFHVDSWSHAQKEITGSRISKHLDVIASDEMEGRETGSPGLKRAGDYIIEKLKFSGLSAIDENGDYRQDVLFQKRSWNKSRLTINDQENKLLRHFYAFTDYCENTKKSYNKVSFMGYGIKTDKLNNYSRAPRSKAAIVFGGQPVNKDGIPVYLDLDEQAHQFYTKGIEAKKAGIETLFIIDDNFKNNSATFNRFILNPRFKMVSGGQTYNGANLIWISPQQAELIFGSKIKKVIKRKNKVLNGKRFKSFEIPADINIDFKIDDKSISGANICAKVEGNDMDLKNETIVISAHYDHLGKRGQEIYNGADDNGSGTSTILNIAEALQKYKEHGGELKRSVIFLFFTGEEKGLLGSQYYTENPLVPLKNTITNFNIDMVGRVDEAHEGNANYVYVIGSDKLSMDLHLANEAANTEYTKLDLDYKYNDENDPNRFYYRSDHYNFAKNNIPVIFYFSGVHEDYHQPSDTKEKIMPDKAAKIGQLCFMSALKIANAKKRPQLK